MIAARPSLTKDNLLTKIDSYTLFKAYCPNFVNLDDMFFSEDRKETSPSCCISKIGDDLLYTDFGKAGKTRSLRIIDYVMYRYGLNFQNTLRKINEDFDLGLGYDTSGKSKLGEAVKNTKHNKVNIKKLKSKPTSIIKIKSRDFDDRDFKYWESYGWKKEHLLASDIKPITHYWLTSSKCNNKLFYVPKGKLVYSYDYYWNKGIFRRKLYLPNTDIHFISNVDDTVVQGKSMLPEKGDTLFITKSYKDIGPFMNIGYYAIAPNAENQFIPEQYFNKLKKDWKNIYIWFDNDDTGIKNSKLFSEKYNIPYFHNDIEDPKDPSDFVFNYSINKFNNYVKQKINE